MNELEFLEYENRMLRKLVNNIATIYKRDLGAYEFYRPNMEKDTRDFEKFLEDALRRIDDITTERFLLDDNDIKRF